MPIRFVYFDLDDTLLDHHHAQEQALADTHAYFGWQPPIEVIQSEYHRLNVDLWKAYSDHAITKEALNEARFGGILAHFGFPQTAATFQSTYFDFYKQHWRFLPQAREAYEKLANTFPVGILTNGFIEIQAGKRQRFPIFEQTQALFVISEEVGVLKPNLEIFQYATKKAGVAPEEILYIGDSYTSDVVGGLNAGWQVAWYHRFPTAQPSPESVFSFSDWETLLARFLGQAIS